MIPATGTGEVDAGVDLSPREAGVSSDAGAFAGDTDGAARHDGGASDAEVTIDAAVPPGCEFFDAAVDGSPDGSPDGGEREASVGCVLGDVPLGDVAQGL